MPGIPSIPQPYQCTNLHKTACIRPVRVLSNVLCIQSDSHEKLLSNRGGILQRHFCSFWPWHSCHVCTGVKRSTVPSTPQILVSTVLTFLVHQKEIMFWTMSIDSPWFSIFSNKPSKTWPLHYHGHLRQFTVFLKLTWPYFSICLCAWFIIMFYCVQCVAVQ